jgi:hypothetical protein
MRIERGTLLSEAVLTSLMTLGWKKLDLMCGKTIPVGIASLTWALFLNFKFENEAGNVLEGFEMSRKKAPTVILFLSSAGEDFLDGELIQHTSKRDPFGAILRLETNCQEASSSLCHFLNSLFQFSPPSLQRWKYTSKVGVVIRLRSVTAKPTALDATEKQKWRSLTYLTWKPEGVPPKQAWRARLTDSGVSLNV